VNCRGAGRGPAPGIAVISAGNNPPDTPPGIVGIAIIPGDQVGVAVHHGLAGSFPDIIPEIVAIRFKIISEDIPAFTDKARHGISLIGGERKIIGDVAERDDEQVTFGNREHIPQRVTERISDNNSIVVR